MWHTRAIDRDTSYPRTIIYVGTHSFGRALQAVQHKHNWHVMIASETLEALAMYIFYYPHLVIIDTVPDRALAEAVCEHLRSVHAQPLVVLADNPRSRPWSTMVSSLHVIDRPSSSTMLVETISDVMGQRA